MWRSIAVLGVLLSVACGDRVGAGSAGSRATPTPIPWISAPASFAPIPTATPEPIPTAVRPCRTADVRAEHVGAQGAGGWWTGALRLTARNQPCLVRGLVELRFLDPAGQELVRSQPSAPGVFRDWAIVGDAQVQWLLSNWCEPRPSVGSILVMLPGDPTPLAAMLDAPMTVGARCNSADGPRGATTMSVRPWPMPVPPATPRPATLAVRIEAPATTIAGEVLRYTVTLTNVTRERIMLDPCPSYIEWLGGHPLPTPAPPSNWPSFKEWTPIIRYAGVAKEAHLLNCSETTPIAAGESLIFEMRLTVPPDAIGSDTLRWSLMDGVGAPGASAPITIERR